ncbi:hypothetical protein E2C01_089655 [Portunus trituberculatus]|uniref:Uncharacterized protein n=1 Tax=Portunus trituberculatus TaxID=210409 RepID=A0A5B7JQ63_PORTR|nr:hypothetical protein [Portunus trituberculatus]
MKLTNSRVTVVKVMVVVMVVVEVESVWRHSSQHYLRLTETSFSVLRHFERVKSGAGLAGLDWWWWWWWWW